MFRNVTFHSQTPGMRSLAKRISADALPAFEHRIVVTLSGEIMLDCIVF